MSGQSGESGEEEEERERDAIGQFEVWLVG